MSNYELAQLNIAVMQAPLNNPQMTDFVANLERNNSPLLKTDDLTFIINSKS